MGLFLLTLVTGTVRSWDVFEDEHQEREDGEDEFQDWDRIRYSTTMKTRGGLLDPGTRWKDRNKASEEPKDN